MSQSSNDTFPTAIHIACALKIVKQLIPATKRLLTTLQNQSQAWCDLVKVGRTHVQDAAPVTLGQVFSGYAAQVSACIDSIETSLPGIYAIAQGGTATGTGLNTRADFAGSVAARIAELAHLPFVSAPNKFALQAAHDALLQMHGAITTQAMACFKIANDIRFLASGPRAGLGELTLPVNEPGSSIMPGKVNPTQCEALTQVCVMVHGNNAAMCFAGSQGHFELNAYKPVMAYLLLQSIQLMADAIDSFTRRCVIGIEPNREKIESDLARSLMLVTALVPQIGYDQAAAIAKAAHASGRSLREEALAGGYVTEEQFDRTVNPDRMTSPDD